MKIHIVDVLIVIAYFAAMLLLGYAISRKSKNTEDYFVAGRSYKGWMLGLSMMSTTISSVTFLAFPAAAFATNWSMAVINFSWPVGMVIAAAFFIPFFRSSRMTTAFDYLNDRFGPLVCLFGVLLFLLSEVVRLGIILYLVSLALASMTGFNLDIIIIVVGVVIAAYTVIGGFEGVIIMDVVQAFVLWLAGLVSIGVILFKLPGGFSKAIEVAYENGKFGLGEMSWNFNEQTFWVMLLLGAIASFGNFTTSQHVIQRYLAAKSLKEARKGALIGAFSSLPTWLSYFFVGTLLWVFYHTFPDPAVTGAKAESVFPHFIMTQFPIGVIGLVIAGIFSAAMSSLDSSINAIATVSVTNIVRRFMPGRPENFYMKNAYGVSFGCGVFMVLSALLFAHVTDSQESVMHFQTAVFAILGGPLIGIFLMGFVSTRIHYQAAVYGIVISFILNVYLGLNCLKVLPAWLSLPIHAFWTNIIINVVYCIVVYVISTICSQKVGNLDGMTIWTVNIKKE